jgi:hypothetical protein
MKDKKKLQLEDIATHLHQMFVGNPKVYAEQDEEGYKTVYKPLNINRIKGMLSEESALMTYQMSFSHLRWVCFDIDIKKEFLDKLDDADIKEATQKEVLFVVEEVVKFLQAGNIPYLLEFSGSRGVHIWVLWKDWIARKVGYGFQQWVLDSTSIVSKLNYCAIDRFPVTPTSNAKLGKGVKLPLSKHQKSQQYATLVTDFAELKRVMASPERKLTLELLQSQLKLLEHYDYKTWKELSGSFDSTVDVDVIDDYINLEKVLSETALTLDEVLNELSNCVVLKHIILRFKESVKLTENERAIFVGLLNRIEADGNPNLGKELLLEFFERQPNFKKLTTENKLRNLKLYPPCCEYLCGRFPGAGCPCQDRDNSEIQKSPLEFITGIKMIDEDIFSISPSEVENLKRAQIKYSQKNDEVGLHFLVKRLEDMDDRETARQCMHYLDECRPLADYYEFHRPESADKTRRLISLGAEDKILSTWFTKILNGLYGSESSDRSFGYKFEPSFANDNLYRPWLGQWRKYIKELSELIENPEFSDYSVVVLDVRSFYDEINLERLAVKLLKGPNEQCAKTLDGLDTKSRGQYRNICETLISWCRKIGDGEKGVPQGPAFARYLAELFLMQFDQDIEDGLVGEDAYYFRYVDDIFLIVRTDILANQWDSELRRKLGELSLTVNEDKAFKGTIHEYRMLFNKYQDESKYFIDTVSWNTSSSSQALVESAADELVTMSMQLDVGGIREKNAAFFLTHLRNVDAVQKVSAELFTQFWSMEYGRGSLFKHISEKLIGKWSASAFDDIVDISGLQGLKLEVFLNTLIVELLDSSLTDELVFSLRERLSSLDYKNFTDTALILYLQLSLIEVRLFDESFWRDTDIGILIKAIRYDLGCELPDCIVNRILNELSSRPVDEVIRVLFSMLIRNKPMPGMYTRSANVFFSIIIESVERDEEHKFSVETDAATQLLKKYHQLVCLTSILKHQKTEDQLKLVWEVLIEAVNNAEVWQPHNPQWLSMSSDVAIDEKNVSAILAARIGGDGFIPGKTDRHKIFSDFHSHLLLFLFASDEIPEMGEAQNSNFIEFAVQHNIKFLEWILRREGDVQLYPSKKICLRNIIENDLMVLKKDGQLLVRQPADRQLDFVPESLDVVETVKESSFGSYRNIIYSYEPSEFVEIKDVISSGVDLISKIKAVVGIYSALTDFLMRSGCSEESFVNVFSDGYKYHEVSGTPLVPDSVFIPKLILSDLRTFDNNRQSGWELLLTIVRNTKCSLLGFPHVYNIYSDSLHDYLIPKDAQGDVTTQFDFLSILTKVVEEKAPQSAHDYDRCLLVSCIRFSADIVEESGSADGRRVPNLSGRTLTNYLSLSGDEKVASVRRLVCHPLDNPSKEKLYYLWKSLDESIKHGCETDTDVSLLRESLKCEFERVAGILNFMATDEWNDSKIGSYNKNPYKFFTSGDVQILEGLSCGELKSRVDSVLEIGGIEIDPDSCHTADGKPVFILKFGAYSPSIEKLGYSQLPILKRSLVYTHESDKGLLLIVPDDNLRACYESVEIRSRWMQGKSRCDAMVREGLVDYSSIAATLRAENDFGKAVEVVVQNHQTSDTLLNKRDFEQSLLRWLLMFKEDEAKILIRVIAAHQYIDMDCIRSFIENVKNADGNVIFSPKKTSDMGGVQRLFTLTEEGQNIFRGLRLDQAIKSILGAARAKDRILVILAENILSGGQLTNAFKWHYFAENPACQEAIKKECWLPVEVDQWDTFKIALGNFTSVKVITGAYTRAGWEKVREAISKGLGLNSDSISIEGCAIDDNLCFFCKTPLLSANDKAAFENIYNNRVYLSDIFESEESSTPLHGVEEGNLLVRPNSVTKGCFDIFTMHPKNKYIAPLFRRIPEHEE